MPSESRDLTALQPSEVLQPVFNALLASYRSAEPNPVELSFCLPWRTGQCLLTISLKSPNDGKAPHIRSVRGGLTPRQLRLILAHMHENLSRPIQIAELATLVGLSASHFQRAFKESIGHAPCAYVSRLRIERSKGMIRDTTQSLSQIALACGLSDQSHFSRLFRKIVGATPAQWRQAIR